MRYLLAVLLLAGCATTATRPREQPLPPLPPTTTVVVALPTTVPVAVAPPVVTAAGPLLDVYGDPIDTDVTFTMPTEPTTTTAVVETTKPPPPTQPPTTACHRKNPKKCRP